MVSRCVVVRLGPVAREDLRELVRSRGELGEEDAVMIEEYAEGMAGWAVEMAEDEARFEEFKKELKEWGSVLNGGTIERVRLVEKLAPDRVAAQEAVNMLARYYAVLARQRWDAAAGGTGDNGPTAREVERWVENMVCIQRALWALGASTMVRPTLAELLISVRAPGSVA